AGGHGRRRGRRRAAPEPARHPAGPHRAAARADPAGPAGPGRGRGRRARPTAGRGGRPARGRAAGRAAGGRLGPRAAGRRRRRRLRVPPRPGQGGGVRRAAARRADPAARPVRDRPGRPGRPGAAPAGRRGAGRAAGGGPGLAAELAWHWYAAHDLERALPAAVEAGRAAERAYAFAEAQRPFGGALGLGDRGAGAPAGLDKAELLARAGEAAANAGAADRAVALVRGALAEVDPAAEPLLAGELTERLDSHLRVAGRPGAMEAYQEAIRLAPPGPTVARARVLAGLGQALMLRARFAEAVATCEEAIQVARAAGAPVVEAHALNSQGTAMARLDDPEGGLARLWESRRRSAELGAVKDEARACVNLPDLLEDLGQLEEAVAVGLEGIEVARAAGLARTFGAFLAGNAAS